MATPLQQLGIYDTPALPALQARPPALSYLGGGPSVGTLSREAEYYNRMAAQSQPSPTVTSTGLPNIEAIKQDMAASMTEQLIAKREQEKAINGVANQIGTLNPRSGNYLTQRQKLLQAAPWATQSKIIKDMLAFQEEEYKGHAAEAKAMGDLLPIYQTERALAEKEGLAPDQAHARAQGRAGRMQKRLDFLRKGASDEEDVEVFGKDGYDFDPVKMAKIEGKWERAAATAKLSGGAVTRNDIKALKEEEQAYANVMRQFDKDGNPTVEAKKALIDADPTLNWDTARAAIMDEKDYAESLLEAARSQVPQRATKTAEPAAPKAAESPLKPGATVAATSARPPQAPPASAVAQQPDPVANVLPTTPTTTRNAEPPDAPKAPRSLAEMRKFDEELESATGFKRLELLKRKEAMDDEGDRFAREEARKRNLENFLKEQAKQKAIEDEDAAKFKKAMETMASGISDLNLIRDKRVSIASHVGLDPRKEAFKLSNGNPVPWSNVEATFRQTPEFQSIFSRKGGGEVVTATARNITQEGAPVPNIKAIRIKQ